MEEGPVDHVYQETSEYGDLKWRFLDKSDAVSTTCSLGARMNEFTDDQIKDLYSSMHVYKAFNKEEYQAVLNRVTPDNISIYLFTPEPEKLTDRDFETEKWYGTNFVKDKFSEALIQKMKNPDVSTTEPKKLSNPVPNTLFPKSYDMLEENKEHTTEVKMIHSDSKIDLWYKQSDKFRTPKVVVGNAIYTNDCCYNINVEGKVFVSIWLQVLEDYFREFTYMASMASMNCQRSDSEGCLNFIFIGYNDTIGEFINK